MTQVSFLVTNMTENYFQQLFFEEQLLDMRLAVKCKQWWFRPTFEADSSFWSWSLLYHSGRPYWITDVYK